MGRKNNNGESASWGLRLGAIALTLLCIVVVFAIRFSDNGREVQAIMWASVPFVAGIVASMLLGKIKKAGSSKSKWQIYTGVLVLTTAGILLNTWLY